MQQTVLILGARGRLGLAAARAFANAGWQVLAQMRPGATPPDAARGDARLQWLPAALDDTAALAAAARARAGAAGVAVVVHALNPAYTHAAWRAQVLPLGEQALALCRTLGATLMLPGNVYNFGADLPALLPEDTPQAARTVKGRIRIGLEEQLRRSGVRCIVLRAGDFFGSGSGNWFDLAMAKDLARGVFTYPGAPDVAHAWAYLPDLARTFVALAERRAQLPAFAVLHFAGHTLSARDWQAALQPLAREQGWLAPGAALRLRGLPWGLIRLCAWAVPAWASLLEMRYLWERPHALDNRRLRTLLGTEPHTPLEQAARAALQDLGLLAPSASAMRAAQV